MCLRERLCEQPCELMASIFGIGISENYDASRICWKVIPKDDVRADVQSGSVNVSAFFFVLYKYVSVDPLGVLDK